MGGINSGRRNGKPTTDKQRSIDIRRLHKAGALTPGNVCTWRWEYAGQTTTSVHIYVRVDNVVLSYKQPTREGLLKQFSHSVPLQWTSCHYGGRRPWWSCPSCGRRVALLYSGWGRYSCRRCFGLAYRSQRETDSDLAARRARAIRARLGWPLGLLEMPGGKPRGMHQKTYLRLLIAHIHHTEEALGWVEQNLRALNAMMRRYQARRAAWR